MNLIEVKDFKKSFGKKIVHRGVSFYLKKGECLGLIGGSGLGKSVLLRSLIGLEKPDSGDIFFEEKNVTHFSEKEWIQIRKRIAYAFQGGALFDSMTVYENLAFPLIEHTKFNSVEIKEKIMTQLSEFGLSGNEDLYPSNLSGGMQKRLGLARAIILDPEIVLYDEPTAGLDPFNTRKIEEMILRLKEKNKSSILVTHDMHAAFEVCDRIALLVGGKIHQVLNTEEVKSIPNNFIMEFTQGRLS